MKAIDDKNKESSCEKKKYSKEIQKFINAALNAHQKKFRKNSKGNLKNK